MAVAAAAAGKLPLLPQDFFQPSESAKLGGTGDKFRDFFLCGCRADLPSIPKLTQSINKHKIHKTYYKQLEDCTESSGNNPP